MKLETRFSSSGFLEIKVDEIEATIFKNYSSEIDELIFNLESVIEDLKTLKESCTK